MSSAITSLSIFFPCYNDAATIEELVVAADEVAREFTDDYEIIVIDDSSQDGSRDILNRMKKDRPRLKLVFHDANKGYGAVLKTGFSNSIKDFIFYTDGDGQYDVRELKDFLKVMNDSVDVINGYKIKRSDSILRIILGGLYSQFTRALFKFHVRDVNCDFRLIHRRVFDSIKLNSSSGAVCLELMKKIELAGFRILNRPVHHHPRRYGRSQFFNFRHLYRTGTDVIRLWQELKNHKTNGISTISL